jgi:hypothetical protein
MKVEYMLNREDWIAYFLYCEKHRQRHSRFWTRPLQLAVYVLFLMMLVVVGTVALFFFTKLIVGFINNEAAIVCAYFIAGLFFFVVGLSVAITVPMVGGQTIDKVQRQNAEKTVDRAIQAGNINTGSQYQVALSAEGLLLTANWESVNAGVFVTERKETRISWAAVQSIETTDYHLIIQQTGPSCLFIPRRVFATSATAKFSDFVEAAERLWDTFSGAVNTASTTMPEQSTAIQTKRPSPG